MQPNAEMSSGQATFDLKAAREICDSIKGQNPEDGNCITHAFYKAAWDLLPDAVDEIEQQAKRIAELEVDNQRWREYNQQLYKANRKKHAALKKLGQVK